MAEGTSSGSGFWHGLLPAKGLRGLITATAAALLLLPMVACGGGGGGSTPTPPPVTATAPTITTAPANQAVLAGQAATFSVAAAGTAPLAYQWQKNGIAVPGAIGASYTTPATVAADNGGSFTVTVSNAAGSVTSSAALLTVNAPPAITSQPAPQTVAPGQTATYSVTATGTAPLTYQWQRNGVAVTQAAGASYTTPPAVAGDNGASFAVLVSNPYGAVLSSAASLSVTAAPVILVQPVNDTVAPGGTATFSVTVSGTPPLSYQWQKNGVAIPLATGPSYTTPAVTAADTGSVFTVVVLNGYGSATSNPAILTVNSVPVILVQPVSQTVVVGQPATFSVSAAGTGLGYQWRRNGIAIPGAVTASYSTAPAAASDSGSAFTVVVSNTFGSVTSNPALLTVSTAPGILTQPASQTVAPGQTATFQVLAGGTAPLSYQWQKNGLPIASATAASYTTPPVSAADNGATFTVTVSNSQGSVLSSGAVLTVTSGPGILTQPAPQSVTQGQTATFSVLASGTPPLTYQWQKNGVAIALATGSSYTTPATVAADSGSLFTVVVSNALGSVTSSSALLTVNTFPFITTQPANQSVPAGQTATFTVIATGPGPYTYQWRLAGIAISGARSNSYTTPPTTAADSGSSFDVLVGNSFGVTISNAATLTVTAPLAKPVINAFSVSPASVMGGTGAILSWDVAGATTLTIDNGVGTVSGATGTFNVSPAATTTYTLTASNAGGTATASTTLTVTRPVISAFSANPMTIPQGGASTLSWTVTGATSLSLDQAIGTVTGTSRAVSPTLTTTYTLTATNSAGSITATATVNVLTGVTGTVMGSFRDAQTGAPVMGAVATLLTGGSPIQATASDAQGSYSLLAPIGVSYGMLVTSTGYLSQTWSAVQVPLGVTYLEMVPLIPVSAGTGSGSVAGTLSDATTGLGVAGLSVQVFSGVWTTTGTPVASQTSGASGGYSFTALPAGYYTIQATGAGYDPAFFTVTILGGGAAPARNFSLNPSLASGQYRMVLNWGATPADLDAHMTGPSPKGGNFHLWYGNPVISNGLAYAQMDATAATGYGPETATIVLQQSGTYTYYVGDHTDNGAISSSALALSGASVRVYNGSGLLQTFYPPYQPGTLWKVFTLNGTFLTPVNSFSYGDPATLGSTPVISQFLAWPAAISAGGSSVLTPIFSNGTGVINPGNHTVFSTVGITVSPAVTTVYTLTVTSVDGLTNTTAVTTLTVQ